MTEQKPQEQHHNQPVVRHEHRADHPKTVVEHPKAVVEHPKAVATPPLGHQNHIHWKPHTERQSPQERRNDHVISPQVDSRRVQQHHDSPKNPANYLHQQERWQTGQHGMPNIGPQQVFPQILAPQVNNFINRGDQWRNHHGHHRDPYQGPGNYWNNSVEENYYFDRSRDRDRNGFPRVIEGILGGLLGGAILSEFGKARHGDDILPGDDIFPGEDLLPDYDPEDDRYLDLNDPNSNNSIDFYTDRIPNTVDEVLKRQYGNNIYDLRNQQNTDGTYDFSPPDDRSYIDGRFQPFSDSIKVGTGDNVEIMIQAKPIEKASRADQGIERTG